MARRRKGEAIHGWLVIDKPLGLSSAAVVGKAKRLLNAAKVGHGGTLDPLASGLLPLAFGEATKTVAYAMDGAKSYRFTVRWGEARSTDDAEGEVIATSDSRPTEADIRAILPRFIGDISQMPPAFSALKVDGQRAYDLARDGEIPELAARTVRIDDLRLIRVIDADNAEFEVDCGKGTYVRALGRDFGQILGCFGYIAALRRTRVGPFTEKHAISLDSSPESNDLAPLSERLLPLMTVLDDILALAVTEEEAKRLAQGQPVMLEPSRIPPDLPQTDENIAIATCGETPVALVTFEAGVLRPQRVFNL
ncbi:tRNA pseudouridine(55) synthase TruB [Lacibacterium aquatile]|uniref:tRNA pseudouridine synthase B n=1 Tax=Lacibacterium aquatile TaxID=1168082 RepID=A0ABW5DWE0_9PROT